MKREERSQAFLRRRKMLLVLPLLAVPFVTMAFWALGGGRGDNSGAPPKVSQGLNLSLPKPHLKDDKEANKLSYYETAEKDSLKVAGWIRNDPYRNNNAGLLHGSELESITASTAKDYHQRLDLSPYPVRTENPEQKILQKLALLEKQMQTDNMVEGPDVQPEIPLPDKTTDFSNDVDRLENMMQVMDQEDETDPEMKQLEATLDKILDIQHPDRVRDRIREKSAHNKEQAFAVTRQVPSTPISCLGNCGMDTARKPTRQPAGFYGTGNESTENYSNAIGAVVHATQTLVNGSVVKLRLLDDIYLNGFLIPKDNFVFGMAALNGERLQVGIHSIRYHQALYPVDLRVYDLDGLAGIYIPGAITRDVAKQSANNSLQMMQLATMDQSLQAQATTAGIETVKNLLSKKVKLVKVTVKAGYKVLLVDSNQK